MLVKNVQCSTPVSFRANETKVSTSSSQSSDKKDSKKLLYALAGLAAIGTGAVVVATKFRKGQLGQKEADAVQNAIQTHTQKNQGVIKAQSTFNAGTVQKFEDGSSKVFDKNAVLRVEKNGKAQKYYSANSKLWAETNTKGDCILYDTKTNKPLMRGNIGFLDGKNLSSPEEFRIYDKNANMLMQASFSDLNSGKIIFNAPDGSKKITFSLSNGSAELTKTKADGTVEVLGSDEIGKIAECGALDKLITLFDDISVKHPPKTLPNSMEKSYDVLSKMAYTILEALE